MTTRGFHSQVSMVTETSVNVLVTPGLLSFSLSPGADGSVKVLFGNWDEEDQTEIGNKIGLRNAKTGSICSHVEALKCQFKCSRMTVSSEGGLMYFLICLYLWFAIICLFVVRLFIYLFSYLAALVPVLFLLLCHSWIYSCKHHQGESHWKGNLLSLVVNKVWFIFSPVSERKDRKIYSKNSGNAEKHDRVCICVGLCTSMVFVWVKC